MKNLTLVLVLSLAAFGCKKKDGDAASGSGSAGGTMANTGGGGDCNAAFDHAMSLEKEQMKKEMPNLTDDSIAKMKDIAVTRCKEDKWSDDVIKCFNDGKTSADVDGCDKKLTKDQKDKLNKDMETAMKAMMPKADGSGGTTPPVAASADLPAECNDYKAAMEKLAACDKMPQASKDALKQGYDAMSQGWANAAALPPEAKKAMADGCKQGADALMQSGKALCGW